MRTRGTLSLFRLGRGEVRAELLGTEETWMSLYPQLKKEDSLDVRKWKAEAAERNKLRGRDGILARGRVERGTVEVTIGRQVQACGGEC